MNPRRISEPLGVSKVNSETVRAQSRQQGAARGCEDRIRAALVQRRGEGNDLFGFELQKEVNLVPGEERQIRWKV